METKRLSIKEISEKLGLSIPDTVEKIKTDISEFDENSDEFNEIKELGQTLNPLDSIENIDKILEQISEIHNNFEEKIENINQEYNSNNKFYRVYKSMMYDSKYSDKYMFYAHLITQCRIKFTDSVSTLGVYYDNGYNLLINLKFIERYSDVVVMGLLKHEMLHILGNHLTERVEDRVIKTWNYATDCAINQLIDKDNLPKNHISYDYVKNTTQNQNLLKEKEAEYYYEELKKSDKSDGGSGGGNSQGGNGGQDNQDNDNESGTHEIWNRNNIPSDDLFKSLTREMIKKAVDTTNLTDTGRGSIPCNISEILNLFNNKSQLNWKQLLRRYQGNKKIDKRQSILKVNRRFMNRDDLRGKISNKTFTTSVIVDVSGSIDNDFIYAGLCEINSICKLTNSSLKIIQVDTEVKKVSDFDKSTKTFERSGAGGTYLYPGVLKAQELKTDVLIVITDGYIESVKDSWINKPKHVIFLLDNNKVKIDYNYPQFYIKSFNEK